MYVVEECKCHFTTVGYPQTYHRHLWTVQLSTPQQAGLVGQCLGWTTDSTALEWPSTLIKKIPTALKQKDKRNGESNTTQYSSLRGCVCVCARMCLTVVGDAGRECFSDHCSHLTSRSTVRRLRQNSDESVCDWIQASHWYKILLSTSWKAHIPMRAHDAALYVILCWCYMYLRLFATVMPINEHTGCASSALGNATSCSQVFNRGNMCIHAFWFSSVINTLEDCKKLKMCLLIPTKI